jgi:hypothetical protein
MRNKIIIHFNLSASVLLTIGKGECDLLNFILFSMDDLNRIENDLEFKTKYSEYLALNNKQIQFGTMNKQIATLSKFDVLLKAGTNTKRHYIVNPNFFIHTEGSEKVFEYLNAVRLVNKNK